jgi:hypothetical protein
VTARDALQMAEQEVVDPLPGGLLIDLDQGHGRPTIGQGLVLVLRQSLALGRGPGA